mmetsp:Transcript_76723/g.197621  ORF Transcript_76723/g.197621 Transcript_76723/m.197621 type:complete len:192 (-) Transcript_76723:439-1014(-)
MARMLQAMRRRSDAAAGLLAAPEHRLQEESGSWQYLIVDENGIKPRNEASYAHGAKGGARCQDGAVVQIRRRRREGGTTWLELASGAGWIFDVSPKNDKLRAVEVEVVDGSWTYQAYGDNVKVLPRPSTSKHSVFHASTLGKGDVVTVTQSIRPLNSQCAFLRLQDGRGFAPDFHDSKRTMQKLPTATSRM